MSKSHHDKHSKKTSQPLLISNIATFMLAGNAEPQLKLELEQFYIRKR